MKKEEMECRMGIQELSACVLGECSDTKPCEALKLTPIVSVLAFDGRLDND